MKETDKMFVQKLSEENANGTELSTLAGSMVNTFGLDVEGISNAIQDQPTARKNFAKIALSWIHELYDMKLHDAYDGRNEFSVWIGAVLYNCLPIVAPRFKYELSPVGMEFSVKFSREHRTLQQSFSSIVFRFLSKQLTDEEEKTIDDYMGSYGYPDGCWRKRLPFI